MNETVEEYEQWKLDGDCSKCKRQRYCTKGCKKAKEAQEREINDLVTKAFLKCLFGKKVSE